MYYSDLTFTIIDCDQFKKQTLMAKILSKMHSCCFGIMGGHGNFAFNLVVKLSVELGYVFLIFRLHTASKHQCLVHCCQFY
jgi:hypothetical protein